MHFCGNIDQSLFNLDLETGELSWPMAALGLECIRIWMQYVLLKGFFWLKLFPVGRQLNSRIQDDSSLVVGVWELRKHGAVVKLVEPKLCKFLKIRCYASLVLHSIVSHYSQIADQAVRCNACALRRS